MTNNSRMVEHLVIPNERVPTAAYQAIYHKLTSKVEKLHEVFPDAYEVAVEDIIQLNERLIQSIKQYPVKSSNSSCSISLREHERMDSSSIEKFRTLNFTTNKPTAAINYRFDFFTELPVEIEAAENIVQRFDVSVIVDQDFVEEDEDSIPLFIKTMSYGSNIRLKIEYSDYSVGRNLQVTIQDWVKNLTTRKVSPVFSFLNKRADFF